MCAKSLKPKHIYALVNHWQQAGLQPQTIHNYMSYIRWWAEKTGRSHVVLPTNQHYGIPPRASGFKQNKAQYLLKTDFERLTDPYVCLSVRLQQAFGLRREESIKFRVSYAQRGNKLHLKGSWTKGGRPRAIPILEATQFVLLREVRALTGSGSLIPDHLLYKHQLIRYCYVTDQAGFRNLHGLRHGYAQRRYEALTGWTCPAAGGPVQRELNSNEIELDQEARLTVSRELGHNRVEITTVYLG